MQSHRLANDLKIHHKNLWHGECRRFYDFDRIEALEIRAVERQELSHSVDEHRCYEICIMRLLA